MFKMNILIYMILLITPGFDFLKLQEIPGNLKHIDIAFVIMSSPGSHHTDVANRIKSDIQKQILSLNMAGEVLSAPGDFSNIQGYWTIFPLLEKLLSLKQYSWIFFIQENTRLHIPNLLAVLKKHKEKENSFVGFALSDKQPVIVHHFDEPQSSVSYPNLALGMAMSSSLLRRVADKWKDSPEMNFSIDPIYEFSKFMHKNCDHVKLTHESLFCFSETHAECATWISGAFPSCGQISKQNIFIAVKTCQKFHSDRVPVVKATWASDANRLVFYSDVEDVSIPTQTLGIENVPRGHCSKTLSIIRHYIDNSLPEEEWLIIADDDTLLSIPRLLRLLSCYNSSETIALGERYGYATAMDYGYDYLTGGAGMVFSVATAQKLADHCQCPSADSPDDMVIGMCLKNLEIPVIHLPYFHQARPEDYNKDLLASHLPISFHKHWMIDPYRVYESYLQDNTYIHNEL